MYNKIIDDIKNKKVLILGFGMEGISTYHFIREYFKEQMLGIADLNTEILEKNPFLKDDKNVTFFLGENYLDAINDFDLVVKSPGVCIKDIAISSLKITSQVEMFLKYYGRNTIGVTGTKGKSTTSSLINHALEDQKYKVKLLGNIGTPIFEHIKDIDADTIVVLELSSDQLTFVNNSPHIGVWLNVFQEHLDHYNSYQEYINAKANINRYQHEEDYFIFNADVKDVTDNISNSNCNVYSFSMIKDENEKNHLFVSDNYIYLNNERIFSTQEPMKLMGSHNLYNIMAVLAVADILHLDIEKTIASIRDFNPLPHRLEYVGKFNDVDYYDDSISTIPESCIASLQAINNIDTVIIGGKDRGIDYSKLIEYINEHDIGNIICMPNTGHTILEALTNNNVIKVNDLKEAVMVSVKITKKGKACILSPAASSYGFFKNFVERGNEFQRLVKELN